jgi:HEAT repeat protein
MAGVGRAPDELLERAGAADWQERCDAAQGLARYDDERSSLALLRLLTDQADTSPIQVAAEALIRRRDDGAPD